MNRTSLAVIAIFALATTAQAEEITVSTPPCIYTGRIKDYDCSGLQHWSSEAEVRVRKDGVLLARGRLGSFDEDTDCNYSVSVPMATKSCPSAAAPGDTLQFEVDSRDSNGASYASTNVAVVAGRSGSTVRLDLRLSSCSNAWGIDDSYIAEAEKWARSNGYITAGESYDPDADWDSDGVSNREEYFAGTDPFDPSSSGLRITSFRMVSGEDGTEMVELGFKPVFGFAYSVERATNSVDRLRDFQLRAHRRQPRFDAPERKYMECDDSSNNGAEQKIYLVRDGEIGLFRIRLD